MNDNKNISRFIKHDETGEEVIIEGKSSETFRKILKSKWSFNNVDKESEWIIIDESGSNITDRPIDEYDGMLKIVTNK